MSALDVENLEAGQGGEGEGSSPSDKEAGLIREIQAQRQTISTLKVDQAEMKGKLDGLSAKTEPVREFTRAELLAQVDDGRMTPDESDRILLDQMKRTVKADVTKDLQAESQAERMNTTVQADIDRYAAARPDIMVAGSADRALVEDEYRRQTTEFGKPANAATERDALAAVFGPSTRLQNGKERQAQPYQETGGGGDGGSPGSKDTGPKLPASVKAHYEKMIAMGMYGEKGWDDEGLKKEIDPKGYGARWAT